MFTRRPYTQAIYAGHIRRPYTQAIYAGHTRKPYTQAIHADHIRRLVGVTVSYDFQEKYIPEIE